MHPKQLLNTTRKFMQRKHVKNILIVLVLLLTLTAFVLFFVRHPQYWQELKTVSPWWIVAVVALNIPMVGLLVLIYDTCLGLCGNRLAWKENFLLTSYSSIINFFGPCRADRACGPLI